ncbi:MAG: DUF3426 domain-containing protein [Alphaproteobacteria bacterium]
MPRRHGRRRRGPPRQRPAEPVAPPPPRARAGGPQAPARAERTGGGLWIWWLLLLLLLAGLAAGGWFARGWLVEVWPPAERVYNWLGIALPRIEVVDLHENVTQEGDTERLVIAGTLVNAGTEPLPAPVVTVILFDHQRRAGAGLAGGADPRGVRARRGGIVRDRVASSRRRRQADVGGAP